MFLSVLPFCVAVSASGYAGAYPVLSALVPLLQPREAAPLQIPLMPGAQHARRAMVRMEDGGADPASVVADLEDKLAKSLAVTKESLGTLRVGGASPSLLDRVTVDYYGAQTPLNQLAMVTAPSASQLLIDPFDKGCVGDIEKALFESDLGMTPSNDGTKIRLNVPEVTTERRKELAKVAKKLGEDGRVAIRNVRKAAMDKVKKMKKEIGEDAEKNVEIDIQDLVKQAENDLAKAVADREKDITGA